MEGSLPSLYEDEERSGPAVTADASTEPFPLKKQRRTTKVVHGVAVDAWAKAHRDTILMPKVTADNGSNLRVFFQCMELKGKSAEPLSERECGRLVARGR